MTSDLIVKLNLTKIRDFLAEYDEKGIYISIEDIYNLSILYHHPDKAEEFISGLTDWTTLEDLGLVKILEDNQIVLRGKAIELFADGVDEFVKFAEEYRNLFPVGVRSGGYLVRDDLPSIINKLRKFTKSHKYTKDQILEATRRYIERKRMENWSFMKTASYFISKDNTSVLGAECEALEQNSEFKSKSKML